MVDQHGTRAGPEHETEVGHFALAHNVGAGRVLAPGEPEVEAAERMHGRSLSYIEQAPFGFFATDEDGKFVFMNARLASWLDVVPERLTERGTKLSELVLGEVPALADGVGESSR